MKNTEYYKSGQHSKNARFNLAKALIKNKECQYCNIKFAGNNIKRHEKSCHLNPINLIKCPVCDIPIKNIEKEGSIAPFLRPGVQIRTESLFTPNEAD